MSVSTSSRRIDRPVFEANEPRLLLSGWLAPTNLEIGYGGQYSDVALRDNGTVVSVCYDPDPAYGGWDADLVYRSNSQSQGGGWNGSSARLIETGDEGRWPALAFDDSGKAHISYYDATDGNLRYVTRNGSWSSSRTVDSAGDVGEYTDIALDSDGNPVILYYDRTNQQIKYAWFDDGSWNNEPIATVGTVSDSDDANLPYVYSLASLALDADDQPHVSFYDHNAGDLMYAVRGKQGWAIQTVESDDVVGVDNALALDAAGRPHIAYFDFTDTDLHYAVLDGGTWDIQTLNDTANYAGANAAMVLDGAGYPHITFKDQTANALGYAAYDGAAWSVSVIDATSYTGKDTSVAINASGDLAVTYRRHYTHDPRLKMIYGEDMGTTPAPDLIVTVGEPAVGEYIPGDTVTVPVTVTNVGTLDAVGDARVNLWASEDQVFGNDHEIDDEEFQLNLAPGENTTLSFSFTLPPDAQPGPCYMAADVWAEPALGEINDSNNTDMATGATNVTWKFGDFDPNRKTVKLTVMGQDLGFGEVPVTFTLSGGGNAEILGGDEFQTVRISNTTAKSSLKITTGGKQWTTIGDLIIEGSLKSLDAKLVRVLGDVEILGTVSKISLGAVTDDHLITIGGTWESRPAKVSLGIVADTQLISGTPLKSVTVTEWLDGDGDGDDLIQAPWIGKLTTKGTKENFKKKIAFSPGDFEANLELTGEGATKATLGSASIKGSLVNASWAITGLLGKMKVTGTMIDSEVRTTDSVGGVSVGACLGSDFLVGVKPGVLGRHAAANDDYENLDALVKSFKVAGLKTPKGQIPPRWFFEDSNVSAARIGSVSLLNTAFDNGGEDFGLWACELGEGNEIKSVKWSDKIDKDTKGKWPAKKGIVFAEPGDLAIRIV